MTDIDAAARTAGYTPAEAARADRALTSWATALRPSYSDAEVAASAAALAAAVAPAQQAAPARRARAWRRRGLVSALGAAVAALAFAGTAAAADGASPGDRLYALDRTLEQIGVGDGGLDERLDEVQQLEDRGDDEAAGDALAAALEDEGLEDAATGVRQAIESVSSAGAEASEVTRQRVGEILAAIENARANGDSVGDAASEAARGMSGDGDNADDPAGSDDAPGNAGDAPGNSGDAPGNSGDAPGNSGNAPGNSGNAPGNSGNAPGNSGDAPGNSGDAPGNSGNAPGNSKGAGGR